MLTLHWWTSSAIRVGMRHGPVMNGRHPLETLTFFGIEPNMTIVEVLPGNAGWYTQILTPLTAEQGRLIGVTYPESLWVQMFSSWNEDRHERFGADITQMARYMSIAGVGECSTNCRVHD